MKECIKCKNELTDESTFCNNCGANQSSEKSERKRNKVLLYLLPAVVILLVASIVIIILFSNLNKVSQPVSTETEIVETVTNTPIAHTDTPKDTQEPTLLQSSSTGNTYSAGQYKIGADMPAGEYIVVQSDSKKVSLELNSDSTGTSDSYITSDYFSGRRYITANDGEYLTISNGIAYPAKEAPKVEIIDGELPEGEYKVGEDIKAGEYKVLPNEESKSVSLGVYSDSRHTSDSYVTSDYFKGEKYITVSDGQYLEVSGGKIKVK